MKALLWEGDGFVLLYKRLEKGSFKWPRVVNRNKKTNREELLKDIGDIIHCDETPVQVLKEEGKRPQTKSYMWLYRSGNDGKTPIILYDYQPSGNGDYAATYMKDFKGYVHSDGYSGYNKLDGIIRCGCWAHLR